MSANPVDGAQLEELRAILSERSVRRGEFVLASGAKSNLYFDSKLTTLSPRGSRLVGEILCDLFEPLGIEAVGGLAVGACFIATSVTVVSDLRGKPIYGFTVRNKVKDHGTQATAESSYHPDGEELLRPGRKVAVIEDVVTKGGSALQAVEVVRQKGCEIAAVVSLIDRQAGGGERLRQEGLPFAALFEADGEGRLSPPASGFSGLFGG